MWKLSSGYRTPKSRDNHPQQRVSSGTPGNPPIDGTAAVAIPTDWRTHPPQRVRRASRAQETSLLHRGRAIARMQAHLATSQVQWLRDVDAHLASLPLRADAKAHRRAIARMVGFHAEWDDLVTRTLTWGTIAAQTGLTRRSVARHLKALHEDGWIARVAAGRSAAAKKAAGWTGPTADENEAPVYALTCPDDDADINVTPPTHSGSRRFHARARPGFSTGAASPPESNDAHAVTGVSDPGLPASPASVVWSDHAQAEGKDERVLACEKLRRLGPTFRKLSARHLAFVFKDFFAAGWTLADIRHAVEHLPTGQAQGHFVDGEWVPYSGSDGIPAARMAHWLTFRLAPWRDSDGNPTESRTQRGDRRREAALARRAAAARARDEQAARRRALAADPAAAAEKEAALAFIHSLRTRR